MSDIKARDSYLSDAYQARKLLDTFPGEYFGAFRDPVKQLIFMGQMFAWAKLSLQNALPATIKSLLELKLQQMPPEDLVPLSRAFDEIADKELEAFEGFGERLRRTGFAYFMAIAHHIQEYFHQGQRDFNVVADVLLESAPVTEVEGWIPRELARLAVELLAATNADSVYCPFTNAWRLASEYSKSARYVTWESERRSQLDAVLAVLSDHRLKLHLSDPITQPSCLDNGGQLKQFDLSAFVSLGRFHKEMPYDPFGRFPEKTASSEVLAIRHALSQTSRSAVGILGHGFLFKTSAGERELKASLINRGLIKSVISLPAGALGGTSIATCLIILDKEVKHDEVLFVDASGEQFWEARDKKGFGSARIQLKNIDELVDVVQHKRQTPYSKLVSAKECEANDYNLLVDRYVLSGESAKLSEVLSSQVTRELEDLAELIRPQSVKSDSTEHGEQTEFLEVGVADIDDDGVVHKPRKSVPVKDKFMRAMNQALKPGDILLAMKGSVGAVGLVPDTEFGKMWMAGQSFIIVRANASLIEPVVLFRLLRSPVCQSYIRSRSAGTTVKMLQMRDIKSLPVPDLDAEQRRRIRESHEELLRLHAESAKLKNQIKQIEQDIWPESGAGGGDE